MSGANKRPPFETSVEEEAYFAIPKWELWLLAKSGYMIADPANTGLDGEEHWFPRLLAERKFVNAYFDGGDR